MYKFNEILNHVPAFNQKISSLKKEDSFDNWYPFGILNNFDHLAELLKQENGDVFDRLTGNKILDIGCADGDLGYFMESMGYDIDFIDSAQPNFNKMQGVRRLKEMLTSKAGIHDMDIDSQFKIPQSKYDLVFFLGILYHLKNPFYVLEELSKVSQFMFISTRVAKFTPDRNINVKDYPLAYILGHEESENGDNTNFFIFSEQALKNLLIRSGWQTLSFITVGDTENSDPTSIQNDERAFCLVESWRYNK